MMRSMYSGVSGLRVHQTKMDVIGNNISNVNTVGFKSSSVTFSDILYQTSSKASGPNANNGTTGTNAKQVGLGANLSSITTSVGKTGGSQRTDNPFDLMIEGDAFFVVNGGNGNMFTKAGSFNIDAAGTLCTPSGAAVMGWQPSLEDPTVCSRDVVSPLRPMAPENMYSPPEATTNVHLTGNVDSRDPALTAEGAVVNVSFYDSLGYRYNAILSIARDEEMEASEMALSGEFLVSLKDIKDESGKSIFLTEEIDEYGNITYEVNDAYAVSLGVEEDDNEWSPEYDDDTGEFTLEGEGVLLSFNYATGHFVSMGDADAEDPINSLKLFIDCEPNPFEEIDIDFSSLTMYNESGSTSVIPNRGELDTYAGAGRTVGNLSELGVDPEGKVFGTYDNGTSRLLGQVAVATFPNPAGLEAVGNNMFITSQNSGEFDGIGRNISSTGGSFITGVLEMSNVDLSQEFTDMITTQRGFQSNSRIITTSDTLLEELINLKR